jgi:hypothetical protein
MKEALQCATQQKPNSITTDGYKNHLLHHFSGYLVYFVAFPQAVNNKIINRRFSNDFYSLNYAKQSAYALEKI